MENRFASGAFGVVMLAIVGFFTLFPQLKPDWLQINAGHGRWGRYGRDFSTREASWNFPSDKPTSNAPTPAEAALDRGTLHYDRQEWDLAIKEFDEVLRLRPKDADVFFIRGAARANNEQYTDALADFDAVLRLRPRDANALFARATTRIELKQLSMALTDLDAALGLDPENVEAYCTRGKLREEAGEYRLAVYDYQHAARRASDDVRSLNCLAWLLATAPDASLRDGKRAVEAALRAVELEDAKEWDTIDTLAAAFAETGKFTEAIRSQNEALRLAPPEEHQDLQARLRLYQAKKPYRLPEKSP